MSKRICEKCGNMIPEDMDACPVCGREAEDIQADLDQEELEAALSGEEETEEPGEISRLIAGSGEADGEPEEEPEPEKPAEKPKAKKPSGKKKKKKKKNSAALVGVVIGLVIALLIIACGVAFALYQMGFFTTMSDEELLGFQSEQETVAPSPTPEVPVSAEEAPVAEEPDSLVEEREPVEEPEVSEEPEEVLVVEDFEITGSSYVEFYDRGQTSTIAYIIEPSEYRDKIQWSSSDESIAVVDSFGTIRARRGGSCTIVGTCGDAYITASVTCKFEVPSTVLDMNMEDITMSYEGQTAELAIDYEMTDDYIKATTWESSDPAVAKVDRNGVVTAVSNGTAIITASIGEYTASCIVRCVDVTGNKGVNPSDSEYVINYEDVTLTRRGEYFQLTLTSVLGKKIPDFTWTSDDSAVATVNSDGVVTAVSNGTAYITTTVGGDQFQCIVRVRIS